MVKSGIFTTEFWVTVFTAASGLIATYGGLIPPPWGIVAAAVVTAGYTISRAFVKTAATPATTPAAVPPAATPTATK